jgi:hypothetical protein
MSDEGLRVSPLINADVRGGATAVHCRRVIGVVICSQRK